MEENQITETIIGCAIKVHKTLGPGLLESAYEECLAYEIAKAGLEVVRQKPIPLVYESVKLDCGYRSDLFVEKKVIAEVKAIEALNDVHRAQTLTYLKLGNYRLGLLMNFIVVLLKDGIKRVINGTL